MPKRHWDGPVEAAKPRPSTGAWSRLDPIYMTHRSVNKEGKWFSSPAYAGGIKACDKHTGALQGLKDVEFRHIGPPTSPYFIIFRNRPLQRAVAGVIRWSTDWKFTDAQIGANGAANLYCPTISLLRDWAPHTPEENASRARAAAVQSAQESAGTAHLKIGYFLMWAFG